MLQQRQLSKCRRQLAQLGGQRVQALQVGGLGGRGWRLPPQPDVVQREACDGRQQEQGGRHALQQEGAGREDARSGSTSWPRTPAEGLTQRREQARRLVQSRRRHQQAISTENQLAASTDQLVRDLPQWLFLHE